MVKRIVVLGGGISGVGAAVLANKNGYDVFVSDNGVIADNYKRVLLNNGIDWEEGGHECSKILNADEIIKSPGISEKIKIFQDINSRKIPVISEVEFAFRYTTAKIVAITGSNGKTTTTLLLGHILKSAGYDVLIAGNIGVGFES